MGTHFDPNCKHFCPDSHFIEFPFYREKIATLFNFFRSPFPEKSTFWFRNPCCLTSFFSKSSHFRESLAICRQNPHFIENPFYREKIAAYFGGISRKIPILSNSHFIENVLYNGLLTLFGRQLLTLHQRKTYCTSSRWFFRILYQFRALLEGLTSNNVSVKM